MGIASVSYTVSVEICQGRGIVGQLNALYHAKTKRVVLLETEDSMKPEFQESYETIIGPCLDKWDAGFATWSLAGPSIVVPSDQLLKFYEKKGKNPIPFGISVLNRVIAIRALKEGQDALTTNNSLELPGNRIGIEILAYMRHVQVFKRWLCLDKRLSSTDRFEPVHVSNPEAEGNLLAYTQGLCRPPEAKPRIILVYSDFSPKDNEAQVRQTYAKDSWFIHFEDASIIPFPYVSKEIPTLKEILDYAAKYALPEDIICYANTDAGLVASAVERIVAGVCRGNGVTCCAKREVTNNQRAYKTLTDYKMPGGVELIAMTPSWWNRHRDLMPDMFIGREAWDAVFMHLAEEWADGRALAGICNTDLYHTSKAHTDNVCWHVEHPSYWERNRHDPMNVHNRELARQFFAARNKKTIWE